MPKKKIILTIPKSLVREPFVYQLVREYNLLVNVLRAQVMSDEEGKIVLEIEGTKENVDRGVAYLKDKGIQLDQIQSDIKIDLARCIDCGACTAVCVPKALSLDKKTWKLGFDRAKCLLCGHCVDACPTKIIKVTF